MSIHIHTYTCFCVHVPLRVCTLCYTTPSIPPSSPSPSLSFPCMHACMHAMLKRIGSGFRVVSNESGATLRDVSPRVHIPNNHILSKIVAYITTILNPKPYTLNPKP